MRDSGKLSDITIRSLDARSGISRSVEAAAALIGLVIALPLIALSALAILCISGRPVLFRQKRVGRNGRNFVLYKLRTMKLANAGSQVTADGDARVTPVGKLLRKTKLDELPELWNIIKGDMSLVGPRPEVPRYVDVNNHMWQAVLSVKPGITDPMTLRLRNEEELMSRVEGDHEEFYLTVLQPYKLKGYLEYLQGRSFWSDVKILFGTLAAVVIPSRVPAPSIKEILSESVKS
jgi:lipopolysaccharide/colanic/teichoic acid biosynthesis glycosyltransferase